MDARERWQALQGRLKAARAAFDAGHRDAALAEVTAALELDGEFLAAQALRDRILAMDTSHFAPRTPHLIPSEPPHLAPSEPPHLAPPDVAPHLAPSGYARFEQRARRRRVDRKIDAARAAIEQQRLKAAAIALDEVIELDPNLPELAELTASFDDLRRTIATPRRGKWLVAASVFVVAVFGASWLQDLSPIVSRQIVSAAPLPTPPALALSDRHELVGTTGERGRVALATMVEPESVFSATALPAADETMLVTQALLGYRWTTDASDDPVGFDRCDPRVENDEATAVCHAGGVAWTVTLRKTADAWRVETARAER